MEIHSPPPDIIPGFDPVPDNIRLPIDIKKYRRAIISSEKYLAPQRMTFDECVIGYERIGYNEYYYRCDTCKKVFAKENLTRWLENSHTCPHCVDEMPVLPQLYRNAVPDIVVGIGVVAAAILVGLIVKRRF